MRFRTFGAAALLTAAGAAAVIGAAPSAFADSCDPAVAVCDGAATAPETGSMDFSPPVTADESYPSDGDFFYNSPGPNEPAYSYGNGPSGGGGHGGGGGHH